MGWLMIRFPYSRFAALSFFLGSALFGDPALAFETSFKWCGNGSPIFTIANVPKGTSKIEFRLSDLMSSYNHGGGEVKYTGQKIVPCGALGFSSYRGPFPPPGQTHVYRFDLRALDSQGKALGTSSAERKFPE